MDPKSISASSIEAFEGCHSRYKTEFIDKIPQPSNNKASLGSACHAALEFWVKSGQYLKAWPTVGDRQKAMNVVWESVYFDFFDDRGFYDEGLVMLYRWLNRTSFENRTVLSCEVKESFELPTSRGIIPVTYIWDRCDEVETEAAGIAIEVIDYKTLIQPVQPEELKDKIQPRIYALAAAIKYKEATAFWVTFDLLRYEPVSVRFTREDNIVTWNYLKRTAEAIYVSDGLEESLNDACRFCIRKTNCQTLILHKDAGGILRHGDSLEGLVDQRHEIKMAADALYQAQKELDELILAAAEDQEVMSITTHKTKLSIGGTSRRVIENQAELGALLGPEIMLRYGKVGIGDLDQILVEYPQISNSVREKIQQLVGKSFSSIKVTTKTNRKFTP